MQVFITGGAGFIGSYLCEYHLAKGDKVHAIDNLSTGHLKNIENFLKNPNFSFDKADLLSWPPLMKTIYKADYIYHLAAIVGIFNVLKNPIQTTITNIMGTEKLFNTIKATGHNPRVMITSTSCVYGNNSQPILKEDMDLISHSPKDPISAYTISKMNAEVLSMAYYNTYKMPITILRLFNTIGLKQTGAYGMVVPRFINQALSQEKIQIFGDGTQTRSFCDVRDTVHAMYLLAENSESIGEIVNVGNDQEISILALAKLIKKLSDSESSIEFISYKEAYGYDMTDIKKRRPDINKLKKLTHFTPQWSLEKSLDFLIKNYSQRFMVQHF